MAFYSDDMLVALWIAFLLLMLFLLGSAVGSFLNVCIVRLPEGRSLIRPASCCGHCHTPIPMRDNLPLLSYCLLRGRCRMCGASFSMRYFWIELLTGLVFVLLYHLTVGRNVHHFDIWYGSGYEYLESGRFPPHSWLLFALHALLACFLIVTMMCNEERHRVPRSVTHWGVLAGLVVALLCPWPWPDQATQAVTQEPDGGLTFWRVNKPYEWGPRLGAMAADEPWWIGEVAPRAGLYPWPVWGPLPSWLPPGSRRLGLATGLAGAAAGAILLGLVRLLFNVGTGTKALGWGETSLLMIAGGFLGWQPVVVAGLIGLLPGLLSATMQWTVGRRGEVSFAAWLTLAVGAVWLGWYWIGPLVQGLFFNERRLLLLAAVCAGALLTFAACLRLWTLLDSRGAHSMNRRDTAHQGEQRIVMSQKTWGGRFSGETDNRVEAFTESISIDRRLYRHDAIASQAHARMLAEVGLLSGEEASAIVAALDAIAADIERGDFVFSVKLEDIHTHIERALIERLGDVGRKLHTGRSRNDQVVTDVKLWVRDALDALDGRLRELQRALLDAAERNRDLVLPGYTHMQRAQPVLAAHYFLAYVEKYQRDRDRLLDCRKRVNVLPLGAAALAGTSLPIDRDSVRRQLGFDALAANSLDVSSDRDFLLEFVFDLSVIALHLSGWAEEWVLWTTTEFGFLDLPDAFCTGSSIMPHKKNPDVLELIRGKSARVVADLQQLLMLVKGLPLAYNRDLQEDKAALFDAHDTVAASLELAAALVTQSRFRADAIASRLEDGYLDATTLMEYCITQGVPMRAAHEAVGKLVRLCEERRCRLVDLSSDVYESVRPGLSAGVYKVLGVANALAAFKSAGSTAPAEVDRQLGQWRQRLA